MKNIIFSRLWIVLAGGILSAAILNLPLLESHRAWLFDRSNSSYACEVSVARNEFDSNTDSDNVNGAMNISISHEELEAFARDGAVILRGVISTDWLRAYRKLLMHVYENPSRWDILYSRMVANFYGAQKSIFLHQSSECGAYVGGEKSPVSRIAARFFSHIHTNRQSISVTPGDDNVKDVRMRVIEPTEVLFNYHDGGHTCWHRDDPYMHYKQDEEEADTARHVVIRAWVPLMDILPEQMTFLALNNSIASKIERNANGLEILGTRFRDHGKMSSSQLIEAQTIGPGVDGFRAGDALFFAGDTPHIAQGLNCTSVGCGRMIFSFALDGKALYEAGKDTSLLPLYSGQNAGKPLSGNQFPVIYPKQDSLDWNSPLKPTYGDVIRSIFAAVKAGLGSFRGYDIMKAMPYFARVGKAFQENVWIKPALDLDTGERLPET